jgi:hypothetical protein
MMEIEGRVAAGLDEFMLRLGHLVTLARVSKEVTHRSTRLEREFAGALTEPVLLTESDSSCVGAYLSEKRLCPDGDEEESKRVFRYPHLRVEKGNTSNVISINEDPLSVWAQDYFLADPSVLSRVGAVTVDARSRSSTGASHIIDWALILGLLHKNLDSSWELQLLARVGSEAESNPYVLRASSKVILGYCLFGADLDLLVRFAANITAHQGPIKKRTGAQLYASAVKQLCEDAEEQHYLTAGKKFAIFSQLKELQHALRTDREAELGSSSTAWHRAASRLESLVDLGLITKTNGGDFRYEYVYFATPLLGSFVNSVHTVSSAREWIENQLLNICAPYGQPIDVIPHDNFIGLLESVAKGFERPNQLFPIDALALGICANLADQGIKLSIASCRKSLESLASRHPEGARLSSGDLGDRAEFISLNMNKF